MTRRRRAALALAVMVAVLLPSTPAHADNIRDAQWHLGFLHVPEAQRLGNDGAGVTVAVVDTGVDATHPDLAGNVQPGTDFVDPGGDGHLDNDGHGTSMAGIISGHGHGNNAGVLGIAPKAQILPVRVMAGSHGFGASKESRGIAWAAQHGVKVMCLAFAGDADDPELKQAVAEALAADVVVVAGAGNRPESSHVGYPAAYPGVVAAAGVDQQGNHADVSVTGPEITLAAPAVDIASTQPNNKYSKGVGTSDATAIIAGVAALVRAKYPNLSAAEVVHRLTATATHKGPPGRDDEYGYGIVNPVAALTADVPALPPSTSPSATDPAPVSAATTAAQPDRPSRAPLVIGITLVGVLIAAAAVTAIVIRSRT
jgi:type VII secretion-associated serine protease mycosin